jgi:hypothetical protein
MAENSYATNVMDTIKCLKRVYALMHILIRLRSGGMPLRTPKALQNKNVVDCMAVLLLQTWSSDLSAN